MNQAMLMTMCKIADGSASVSRTQSNVYTRSASKLSLSRTFLKIMSGSVTSQCGVSLILSILRSYSESASVTCSISGSATLGD